MSSSERTVLPVPLTLNPKWIVDTTSSCDQLTIRFNLPVATALRLIDVNGNAPALFEKDITQPAGKSTFVWSLPAATRAGSSDSVEIWTAGPNTRTLLRTAVPINCAIAPAQKIAKTLDTGTPPNQTVPVSSNTKLANTGNQTELEVMAALGLIIAGVALIVAGFWMREHRELAAEETVSEGTGDQR